MTSGDPLPSYPSDLQLNHRQKTLQAITDAELESLEEDWENDSDEGAPSVPPQLPEKVKLVLDKQRAKLAEVRKRLEEDKAEMAALRHLLQPPPARVRLNVSGHRFEAPAATLSRSPFFKALLSSDFAPPDPDGYHFLERDPRWTLSVVRFLQEGNLDLRCYNQRELAELRGEADFFMVGALADRCTAQLGPFLYSTLLEVPASGNGVAFELIVKRQLQLIHICFFPYTNCVEEITVHHSEGGLMRHKASRWHRQFKGKLTLKSALLCKIEFSQPLFLPEGRHTLSVHCPRNDSAVTYTAKPNVIQPCQHFAFGGQAGLKADPETPHALNMRFFVGKIYYALYEP